MLEVGAETGLVGYLLKKPNVTIEPVLIRVGISRTAWLLGPGQTFGFTHIPVIRKDKSFPFLQTGKDITLPGNELLVLVYNTPMAVNILSIPILVNRIWMSGCVHIPSVLMDGYLIDAFLFCWT